MRLLIRVWKIPAVTALVCLLVLGTHLPVASSASASDPVIAAAGDIACDQSPTARSKNEDADDRSSDGCQQANTASILKSRPFAAILPLGDEQYPNGSASQFHSSYAITWGAVPVTEHPVPGNHEYQTPGASGYYRYFGTSAGDSSKGYYSWDLGSWHFIAINANCSEIGGCGIDSPEERWLRADLARHRSASCIVSYWHQPRFSSGPHHSDAHYQPFWSDLYAARADVVLNGHDHDYERFAPQTPTGEADAALGIREFVVGTGGKSHYVFTKTAPNSEVRNNTSYGILELTLHSASYDWKFVHANGTFEDSGSGRCHSKA